MHLETTWWRSDFLLTVSRTPESFSSTSILKAVALLLFRMFPIAKVTLSRYRKV